MLQSVVELRNPRIKAKLEGSPKQGKKQLPVVLVSLQKLDFKVFTEFKVVVILEVCIIV